MQTNAIIDIVQIIQHFQQEGSKKHKQTEVLPNVPILSGVTGNRFFFVHRTFRICSTWHAFGPCYYKKRLRDLPRQIERHGWYYSYLWEFPLHLLDNTNSSFLLSFGSVLNLSLLMLNVWSEPCLMLQFRNTFYMRLLPSRSTGLYTVKHQSQMDQTVLQ